MSKKPHQDSQIAIYISRRVLELKAKKSQGQIAEEAGFPNANMITMMKQGVSKLAIDRVPAMARALECDPAYLMRLAMAQAHGETAAQALIEIFGTPVSANEHGWLDAIRDASENSDPRLTSRSLATLRSIFGK